MAGLRQHRRPRRRADALTAVASRSAPGSIPIAAWFIPKQLINDTWRAAAPRPLATRAGRTCRSLRCAPRVAAVPGRHAHVPTGLQRSRRRHRRCVASHRRRHRRRCPRRGRVHLRRSHVPPHFGSPARSRGTPPEGRHLEPHRHRRYCRARWPERWRPRSSGWRWAAIRSWSMAGRSPLHVPPPLAPRQLPLPVLPAPVRARAPGGHHVHPRRHRTGGRRARPRRRAGDHVGRGGPPLDVPAELAGPPLVRRRAPAPHRRASRAVDRRPARTPFPRWPTTT